MWNEYDKNRKGLLDEKECGEYMKDAVRECNEKGYKLNGKTPNQPLLSQLTDKYQISEDG